MVICDVHGYGHEHTMQNRKRNTLRRKSTASYIWVTCVCYNNISPYLMSFIFNDFIVCLFFVFFFFSFTLACAALHYQVLCTAFSVLASFGHSALAHRIILSTKSIRIIIYDPNKCLGLANYLFLLLVSEKRFVINCLL